MQFKAIARFDTLYLPALLVLLLALMQALMGFVDFDGWPLTSYPMFNKRPPADDAHAFQIEVQPQGEAPPIRMPDFSKVAIEVSNQSLLAGDMATLKNYLREQYHWMVANHLAPPNAKKISLVKVYYAEDGAPNTRKILRTEVAYLLGGEI